MLEAGEEKRLKDRFEKGLQADLESQKRYLLDFEIFKQFGRNSWILVWSIR